MPSIPKIFCCSCPCPRLSDESESYISIEYVGNSSQESVTTPPPPPRPDNVDFNGADFWKHLLSMEDNE